MSDEEIIFMNNIDFENSDCVYEIVLELHRENNQLKKEKQELICWLENTIKFMSQYLEDMVNKPLDQTQLIHPKYYEERIKVYNSFLKRVKGDGNV